MGIGQILAENERLRADLAARDALLSEREAGIAERDVRIAEDAQRIAERDVRIAEDAQRIAERDARIAEDAQRIEALRASNETLARLVEVLRGHARGPKSERFTGPESPLLPFGGASSMPAQAPRQEGQQPDKEPAPKKRKGTGRRNLAERNDLPTTQISCPRDRTAGCPKCGGALKDIGKAVSHRLEWVPGHFERLQVEREKCVCPHCPDMGVLTAPEPPFALPRALCGNTLLATVVVDKFADGMPLNRQAARFARAGVEIETSVLASWVLGVAALLHRVAVAVGDALLTRPCLQGDDTGFPVQDGGNGALRRGQLWCYTDGRQVRYLFSDSKRGDVPLQFLSRFDGETLLVDCGSEFNQVVRELEIDRAGCWSHLRRYFFECRHSHPEEASIALGVMRELFTLEASLQGLPLEQIRQTRQAQAGPLVAGFFSWCRQLSQGSRPGSALAKAVAYGLRHEAQFRLYLDRPEVPFHNNLSELQLRRPVVGRKAWLFARSEGGAVAAADLYTLIGSCILQGIDPLVYLTDILDRINDHPANRVHELTPENWRLARQGMASSPG